MKNSSFIVEDDSILFDFLKYKLINKSKNNIKSLLLNEHIYVNNVLEKKYDYSLKKGDIVSIKTASFYNKKCNIKINIIYEDNDLIVIDKQDKILSISDNKEKSLTMYHMVMEYLKSKNKNNKVFIIHRLDKDTSGVLMFAKSEKIKKLFQDNWNKIVINRCYYAIVEGKINNKKGVIKSYLFEDNNHIVHSTNNSKKGKLSISEYNVIKTNKSYSLVDINIKTGRKNQIRVHMSEMGNPVVGDKKYGIKGKSNRLYLHAYKLELTDPRTNKIIKFESDIPSDFEKLIK